MEGKHCRLQGGSAEAPGGACLECVRRSKKAGGAETDLLVIKGSRKQE